MSRSQGEKDLSLFSPLSTGPRHPTNSGEKPGLNCVALYELGDSYICNFTAEQLACSYPARTWFDRGIVAVCSSDVPLINCDVLVNLHPVDADGSADGSAAGRH